MSGNTPEADRLRSQYQSEWSEYAQKLEADVQILHKLKQGMELLLLVCAFLAFYLIDCLVKATSL